MKNTWLKVLAVALLLCLTIPMTASAEPKWVGSYRDKIRQDFKPATCSYYGLYDIGPDGSPELLIGVRSGYKVKVYVYYITKSGYVRKSSKYANLGEIVDDYYVDLYDTGDGEIVVLNGASDGQKHSWSNRIYEISQTASKVVRVKEMFRIDGSSTLNPKFKTKYYHRGKKYSYSKYNKYYDRYMETLGNYWNIGQYSVELFDTLDEVIRQFELDAHKYY